MAGSDRELRKRTVAALRILPPNDPCSGQLSSYPAPSASLPKAPARFRATEDRPPRSSRAQRARSARHHARREHRAERRAIRPRERSLQREYHRSHDQRWARVDRPIDRSQARRKKAGSSARPRLLAHRAGVADEQDLREGRPARLSVVVSHATSTTGRQNAPEQPCHFIGNAQNLTGCGNEKASAGNLSSSTTQMPDPSKIGCVEEFPEKRRGPSRAHSNVLPLLD